MLFNKKTLISTFSLLSVVFSQEAAAPEGSAVVKLNGENFKEFIEDNPLAMVEFFAPWCGHCKRLAPEYIKAAEELKEKYGIPLCQIDCTENNDLCMEQGIRGYPTVRIFKGGNISEYHEYPGARSADAIIQYMFKQSQPIVKVVNSEKELKEALKDINDPTIVDTGVKGFNETFYKVAKEFSDEFTFISFPQKADSKQKLSLYLVGEKKPIEYPVNDKNKLKKLISDPKCFSQWVNVESLPYFGDVDGSNFDHYMSCDLPLAYFFYTTDEERENYDKFFNDLGKKYRGEIIFVGLDSRKFGRHAENLNMKLQFPLFAIHNVTSNLKYGLPQMDEEEFADLTEPLVLEEKEIIKFVKDFIEGKVEPIVKSEPIPEKQEFNVTKLVGKTHENIVHDENKDVLVKYYAPWCGHCKRMAPAYLELADWIAGYPDVAEHFVIAEIDHTANDVGAVEILGYPTVLLFPAKKDAEPIQYDGDRSVESFLKFLKDNAVNDISAVYKAFKVANGIVDETTEVSETIEATEVESKVESKTDSVAHDEL